jgi:hypothetical protein
MTEETALRQAQDAAKKLGDARFIAVCLNDAGIEWTIENALAVLAKGRANKPLAWTITAEELPAVWAEMLGIREAR